MAAKARSRLSDPIEDVLGDLLGFDEEPPAPPSRGSRAPFPQVSPRRGLDRDSGGEVPPENGKFPAENVEGAKDLDELEDLDELDAEILGMARAGSRPGKRGRKGLDPGKDPGDPLEKPFLEEEPAGPGSSSGNRRGQSRDSAPALPRPDVTFGDDVDDLVDSLGLGNGTDGAGNAQRTPGGQGLRKGRAGIQELLGGGSTGKTLERPGKAEFRPDPKEQAQPDPGGRWEEQDFPFGSYEPSVASGTGRRRGPRFPAGSSSRRSSGAAWLGLKDEDFPGLGSKEKDFPGLEHKNKDFPGLESKDKDFLGLGQKDKDFPGLGSKDEGFLGLGSKEKDFPGLEHKNKDFPGLRSKDKDFPGLGQKDKDFLGLGRKDKDFPGSGSKEDFPGSRSKEDPGALRSHPLQEDPRALPSQPHREDSQTLPPHPCQEHPGCGIALRSLQARVEELENQVRTLELERAQQGLVREDLLESSHRSQGKVQEQQERPRREKEQIPPWSQDTARDQPRPQDQPTSQDQPRSRDHPTSQEWAEQLTALQDRLCRQQRDAEREQSRLQEAVADLETRLGEREQLLEQERRRAAAERSRADSLRDTLEEQRRLSAQLLAMERAALDEAKGAWLEEQRAELRDRSEERRRLAAAWAEFHTRERLSRERAEQDKERALSMDSALRSLAKEQAELKFRSRELRSKEEQLARDREELDEAWRELRLGKEKVLRAEQRLREREEQIHALAERSAREHQDGERALREARGVQAEQRERLQALQEQLEQLRQQEQRLHQDRLSLARQRQQLQQLRDELSHGPGTLPGTVPISGLGSALAAPGAPGFLPALGMFLGDSGDHLGSAALYGHLLLLKHRAQMDHDFLESERVFLQSLKKGP